MFPLLTLGSCHEIREGMEHTTEEIEETVKYIVGVASTPDEWDAHRPSQFALHMLRAVAIMQEQQRELWQLRQQVDEH